MSARNRKKKTGNARSNYVQKFSTEDLKQYFLHRRTFYDSDEDLRQDFDDSNEDHSEDNDYDDYEYYGMHGDN